MSEAKRVGFTEQQLRCCPLDDAITCRPGSDPHLRDLLACMQGRLEHSGSHVHVPNVQGLGHMVGRQRRPAYQVRGIRLVMRSQGTPVNLA